MMVEEPRNDSEAGPEASPPGEYEVRRRTVGVSTLNWIVLGVLAVAFLLLLWIRPQPTVSDPTRAPGVGHKLSVLDLAPLTGGAEPVSLRDLAGKVTLINFWATWCPPCQLELPEIAELENMLRGQADVRVLAVSCAPENPAKAAEATRRLLASMKIDMPTYADPSEATQRALMRMDGFSEFGYPTTLVLDQEGVIRAVWPGYAPGAGRQMEEIIQKLRAGGGKGR